MSLELFPYKGMLLTKSEIRLLEFAENRKAEKRRLEDEKRQERLLMMQSLQPSLLTGLNFTEENTSKSSSTEIDNDDNLKSNETSTIIPTDDDLLKLKGFNQPLDSDNMIDMDISTNSDIKMTSTKRDKNSTISDDIKKQSKDMKKSSIKEDHHINMSQDSNMLSQEDSDKISDNLSSTTTTATTTTTTTTTSRIRKRQKIESEYGTDMNTMILQDNLITDENSIITYQYEDIFSPIEMIHTHDWSPQLSHNEALAIPLTHFGIQNKQTIGIKLTNRLNGRRWSLNICPYEHDHFNDYYMHFNPRFSTKEIVMNDLQGTWGRANQRTRFQGNIFSQAMIQLVIYITLEGFHIYGNKQYIAFFPHRRDISQDDKLYLHFPALDGEDKQEDIVVHNVWWGRVDPNSFAIPGDIQLKIQEIRREPHYEYVWPSIVRVSGLPQITDAVELYEVEKALYGLFEEYSLVSIKSVSGTGIAYVRMTKEEDVQHAIEALSGSIFAEEYTLILTTGKAPIIST